MQTVSSDELLQSGPKISHRSGHRCSPLNSGIFLPKRPRFDFVAHLFSETRQRRVSTAETWEARQKVIHRRRPTNGGSGTTTMTRTGSHTWEPEWPGDAPSPTGPASTADVRTTCGMESARCFRSTHFR